MDPGTKKTSQRSLYLKHRETIHNFVWRAIQILGKQGVTFIIFVMCAKLLPPLEFGIYNYIFALIFMFAIFSDFGVSVTASRYTAQYLVSDKEKLRLLPFNSILVIMILGIIISLVVIASKPFVQYHKYLLFCLPMIFAVPLTSLCDGLLRGLKKFRELSLVNFIFGMFFIPAIYLFVTRWGITGAIVAHNLYYILLFIVILFLSKTSGLRTEFTISRELIEKVVKYSVLVGISDIGLFLYTRADVIVLGHFNLIEDIGYYEIVNRIYLILILPPQLLATVVAPKIAQIFVLKKSEEIKSNYRRDLKLLLAAGIVVALVSYLLAGPVFSLLFENYNIDRLYQLLVILLVLVPFRYFSTYMSIGYITPSGNVSISTVMIVAFGILNILLDLALIQQYGLLGVVYATLISQILFVLVRDSVFYFLVIRKI